jgi:hypothetical protein
MATGACGICCDVCKLHVLGLCSTCGPGTSDTGIRKREGQERLLGAPCPILACAGVNGIEHCLRDCGQFPCENFTSGPYPFSRGFLEMQGRRREESNRTYAPDGSHLDVDAEYWNAAAGRDRTALCHLTFFELVDGGRMQFPFLGTPVQVDFESRCLRRKKEEAWLPTRDPLLEMVAVIYLASVRELLPMGKDIVGVKDLKEGHFFAGPHVLQLDPLVQRFGTSPGAFRKAAAHLNGTPMEMADAAFRLLPFPRIPIYYLLWQGDAEFKPRIQVLFDRSIETVLAADAIWALVNRVSRALVEA